MARKYYLGRNAKNIRALVGPYTAVASPFGTVDVVFASDSTPTLKYEMTDTGLDIMTESGDMVAEIVRVFPAAGVDPLTVKPWETYSHGDVRIEGGCYNSLEAAKYSVLSQYIEALATRDRAESARIAKEEEAAGRA